MRVAIAAFTRSGLVLAERIAGLFSQRGDFPSLFAPERLSGGQVTGFASVYRFAEEAFEECGCLVFVGACGIAVRAVAPLLQSKGSDPAVLSVDEGGRFVIPLLSGHLGGANALAVWLADKIGAVAAASTATDLNGRFAADVWAKEQGLVVGNLPLIKEVSAAVLEERPVGIAGDFPLHGTPPPPLRFAEEGEIGIEIGYRQSGRFQKSLWLIPQNIAMGIGCKKGTGAVQLKEVVDRVLYMAGIPLLAVKAACSIDLKKEEEGLLAFLSQHRLPLVTYRADELAAVEGEFTASSFVKRITGVDNVCERACLCYAQGTGKRFPRLLQKKVCGEGVTVALACWNWEGSF